MSYGPAGVSTGVGIGVGTRHSSTSKTRSCVGGGDLELVDGGRGRYRGLDDHDAEQPDDEDGEQPHRLLIGHQHQQSLGDREQHDAG